MNELIIGKTVAYGAHTGTFVLGTAKTRILDNSSIYLTEGALLIANDKDLSIKIDTSADPATNILAMRAMVVGSEYVRIGVGLADKSVKWSDPVYRQNQGFTGKKYAAAVAQTSFLGRADAGSDTLNEPSPLVVGTTASVRIHDLEVYPIEPAKKKMYSYTLATGDTIDTVVTALVALINADTNCPCTASNQSSGLGIKFVGKVAGNAFMVQGAGILINAPLAAIASSYGVMPVKGSGLPAQICALEKEWNSERGDSMKGAGEREFMWLETSLVDTTKNYDTYTITSNSKRVRKVGVDNGYNKTVVIAVPTGGATITGVYLEQALTAIFDNDALLSTCTL